MVDRDIDGRRLAFLSLVPLSLPVQVFECEIEFRNEALDHLGIGLRLEGEEEAVFVEPVLLVVDDQSVGILLHNCTLLSATGNLLAVSLAGLRSADRALRSIRRAGP